LKISYKILLSVIIGLIGISESNAQYNRNETVVALIFGVVKNIKWPEKSLGDSLKILVVSEDTEFVKIIKSISPAKKLQKKSVFFSTSKVVENVKKFNVIFIDKDKSEMIKPTFQKISTNPILLITDSYSNLQYTMINFFNSKEGGKIEFNINNMNLMKNGFSPSPDLILTGGSDVDMAELYKKSQAELSKLSFRMDSLQNLKSELDKKIKNEEDELKTKALQIDRSQVYIDSQNIQLKRNVFLNEKITNDYLKLKLRMKQDLDSLKYQSKRIEIADKELSEKKSEMEKNSEILKFQLQQIQNHKSKIKNLDNELTKEERKIDTQNRFLQLSILYGMLSVIAVLLIFRAYRKKNKIYNQLKIKKEELSEALTELNATQDMLVSAKEKAETASKAKTEFIAGMSHELRTPLNAIIGFSKILFKAENISLKQKQQINTINSAGEHLLSLINDILDFGKIEIGKTKIDPEDINLHELVLNVFNTLQIKATEKSLKYTIKISENTPQFVNTDPRIVRQILFNILGNAVKYTEKGLVEMNVGYEEEKCLFVIEIKDTGPGIPKDKIKDIFQPFTQLTEKYEKSKGTGLGLALVELYVNILDGNLNVESKVGEGSSFTVFLPLKIIDRLSKIKTQVSSENIIGYKGRRINILIADDNLPNLQLLQDFLVGIDFVIHLSKNGKQAVEKMTKETSDLAILDMDMPVMNGYEAAVLIREFCPEAKIIGVSAFSQLDVLKNNFVRICDFFMPKPIDLELLTKKIQEYFNLEWIYGKNFSDFKPETLIFPDSEILIRLLDFVEKGDYDSLEQLLLMISEKNKSYQSFKEKAEDFINDFDDEGLKKFLKAEIHE
jgi:signal transduction histidine kinase/CheY-like chemotaxis protein